MMTSYFKFNLFLVLFCIISMLLVSCGDEEEDVVEVPEPIPGVIEVLRTSDDRFDNLPGYSFAPNYVNVQPGNLRMHYIDEGPADGELVLLLHGNPAWTYLVRDMVTQLAQEGYHVIAPDLIGFGRSDKPVERSQHTYDQQEAWVTSFIEELNLTGINAHFQDWGGLLGLRVAIRHPERFATVAISNTGLPIGDPQPEAFLQWRNSISQEIPNYNQMFLQVTTADLTAEEANAYDAPYPSEEYKAGPRELPQRVPIDYNDPEGLENKQLLEEEWTQWVKPFIILNGDSELGMNTSGQTPTFSASDSLLIATIPGAAGQPHAFISNAGHYVQEDAPGELTNLLINFIESN